MSAKHYRKVGFVSCETSSGLILGRGATWKGTSRLVTPSLIPSAMIAVVFAAASCFLRLLTVDQSAWFLVGSLSAHAIAMVHVKSIALSIENARKPVQQSDDLSAAA